MYNWHSFYHHPPLPLSLPSTSGHLISIPKTGSPFLSKIKEPKSESAGGKLQGISEELVHLCDLSGDRKVDCSVTDFDDESTEDIWVDL